MGSSLILVGQGYGMVPNPLSRRPARARPDYALFPLAPFFYYFKR